MKIISLLVFILISTLSGFSQEKEITNFRILKEGIRNNVQSKVDSGRYDLALSLVLQFKDSLLSHNDTLSNEFMWCLGRESEYYYELGSLEAVVPVLLRVNSILRRLYTKESQDYILGCGYLANTYMDLGRYLEAETLFREALALQEKLTGKNHFFYISCLASLGRIKSLKAEFKEAAILLNEALVSTISLFGNETDETAIAHMGLATFYIQSGEPEKAVIHLNEQLRIIKNIFGTSHWRYGLALMNLAEYYQQIDQYSKAEKYLRDCIFVYTNIGIDKLSSIQNIYYITALQALANTYDAMNKPEKAYFYSTEVDSFCKTNPTNLAICQGIGLLKGNILLKMGEDSAAERTFLEFENYILEKTGTKQNPQFAKAQYSLANIYVNEGRYEKAEAVCLEACDIFSALYGNTNPEYLDFLGYLGLIYLETSKFDKAFDIFKQIRETRETLNPESMIYYNLSNSLSEYYHKTGQIDSARAAYRLQMESLPYNFLTSVQLFSEREFLAHGQRYIRDIQRFQSFLIDHSGETSLFGLHYNLQLLTKSIFLDNRLKLQSIFQHADSTTQEIFSTWRKTQTQLYDTYSESMDQKNSTTALEADADSLEIQLLKLIPGFSEIRQKTNWRDIQSSLQAGEAAIEISRIPYNVSPLTKKVIYVASIIVPESAQPNFIPLCNEDDLSIILDYGEENKKSTINKLYTYSYNGQNLFHSVWAPIDSLMTSVKKIYLSPDGLFHRINISAIPIDSKRILENLYDIILVTSTRDIVDLKANRQNQITRIPNAFVFGGLTYDDIEQPDQAGSQNSTNDTRGEMIEMETDHTLRKSAWPYLPYSKIEADEIQKLFFRHGYTVSVLTGKDGTEFRMKETGRFALNHDSPSILHISTHGFFFPETKELLGHALSSAMHNYKLNGYSMLRSGLLMAGANPYWLQTKSAMTGNDGILTAYEISQLNLAQTDLVVLSACETGLGDIKGSEGVFGLQRAFKIAGASKVMTSLWQVPDFQTYELMDLFYKGYLEEKLSPGEALKFARDKMRKKRYEPFYWAGFVLME